ncbi:MAG: thiamine pyrophosphokinae, catalytic region [Frankiales bacterium]|nr:thiamine pyrophosphokinae, catalytic region [Frankiales bacterium]
MKLLRRSRDEVGLPGVTGTARLDRRTRDLVRRLAPGEIAVVDHLDLDRVTADALVARGVAAVVNVSPSTSGRYPNLGPEVLLAAGVPLLDGVGRDVFTELRDGDTVRVHGGELLVGERVVATGTAQTLSTVEASQERARQGLATVLEDFAANTREHLLTETDLLLDGVGVPEVRTSFAGRHALVVVRGYDHEEDLALLRSYVREHRPVLVGVDGGADALVAAGYTPDVVVGDVDAVSDATLRCGAEVVVQASPDGRAPGLQRVQDLGVDGVVFPAAGTSTDVALLLADEGGASLIVAVGTHATLVEFLDQGRAAMASGVLTRLRVGGKLVDARAVSQLHRRRISVWSLLLLVLAAVVAMVAAVLVSSVGRSYGGLLGDELAQARDWVSGLF